VSEACRRATGLNVVVLDTAWSGSAANELALQFASKAFVASKPAGWVRPNVPAPDPARLPGVEGDVLFVGPVFGGDTEFLRRHSFVTNPGSGPGAHEAQPNFVPSPHTTALPGDELSASESRRVALVQAKALAKLEAALKTHAVCAVFMEAVLGPAGVYCYRTEFLQRVRALCDEYRAALVFDEVLNTMRTGKLFSWQHYGVAPDLITIGKGAEVNAVLHVQRPGGINVPLGRTTSLRTRTGVASHFVKAAYLFSRYADGAFDGSSNTMEAFSAAVRTNLGIEPGDRDLVRFVGHLGFSKMNFSDVKMAAPHRLLPLLTTTTTEANWVSGRVEALAGCKEPTNDSECLGCGVGDTVGCICCMGCGSAWHFECIYNNRTNKLPWCCTKWILARGVGVGVCFICCSPVEEPGCDCGILVHDKCGQCACKFHLNVGKTRHVSVTRTEEPHMADAARVEVVLSGVAWSSYTDGDSVVYCRSRYPKRGLAKSKNCRECSVAAGRLITCDVCKDKFHAECHLIYMAYVKNPSTVCGRCLLFQQTLPNILEMSHQHQMQRRYADRVQHTD
jgi:hypothetical protein